MVNTSLENCLCGSRKKYPDCCEKFILGTEIPSTPEQLMRSRYTAYAQGNIDYISHTMCGKAAEGFNPIEAQNWANHVKWIKLKVLNSRTENQKGFVEFKAYYADERRQHCLHEISEFHFIDGKWFYVDSM